LSRRSQTNLAFSSTATWPATAILKHAGKLGFEGVVSKTIDAPYAPGNRGPWRESKWLNGQEFVIVGWSDPEGSRPHLGALLLGYYTDDGKLIYAGRVGTGCPSGCSPICGAAWTPLARALGRAEACLRDHLFDLDCRQPLATHGLRRPAGGQAGGGGSAGSPAKGIGRFQARMDHALGDHAHRNVIRRHSEREVSDPKQALPSVPAREGMRKERAFVDGVANGSIRPILLKKSLAAMTRC
jgi:hypothetical protein